MSGNQSIFPKYDYTATIRDIASERILSTYTNSFL